MNVIINKSLENSPMIKFFEQVCTVRFASSTIVDTCIFPVASIAFCILRDATQLTEDIIERVQKFTNLHCYNCIVIPATDSIETIEKVCIPLQERLFPTQLNIMLPDSLMEAQLEMFHMAVALGNEHKEALDVKINKAVATYTSSNHDDIKLKINKFIRENNWKTDAYEYVMKK